MIFFVLLHTEMHYLGEIISLIVACSWTVTALVSEIGTKRIGVLNFNVWRLAVALLFTLVFTFCLTGYFGAQYAGPETWFWMGLSGFVGFFFGDFCLFKSYLYISSRYGQLFMTLAPAAAAFAAWVMLGEMMTWGNMLAMTVTLLGIGITVLQKGDDSSSRFSFKSSLPLKGILYGLGAGLGQGLGLVLSKIGMEHYEADIPQEALAGMEHVIPFSANMIRCLVGCVCFLLAVLLNRGGKELMKAPFTKKTALSIFLAVMFGPFLGVGFSLMAVQLTKVGIAQTLMALTPILIIVPSYWLFKQPITLKGVLGAVISVIGVTMFFLL